MQGPVFVYFNGKHLGLLTEDGVSPELQRMVQSQTSNITGGGSVAHASEGQGKKFKLTLKEYNKDVLKEVFNEMTWSGTSTTDGQEGTIEFGSVAGKPIIGKQIVINPVWTDRRTGVTYGDPISTNKLAAEIFQAVCISSFTPLFDPRNPMAIELEFEAEYDLSKEDGKMLGKVGTGISLVTV